MEHRTQAKPMVNSKVQPLLENLSAVSDSVLAECVFWLPADAMIDQALRRDSQARIANGRLVLAGLLAFSTPK